VLKNKKNKGALTLKNIVRLKVIITMTTNHGNQNRQAQRTLKAAIPWQQLS